MLTAGGSAGGCLVRGPPGGLGGRLVAGVPADHRENGLSVRVVQPRHGLEGLIRLLEPADPPEFREVEGERLLTEISSTALDRGAVEALVALLTEDVTWSMPPLPRWYHGIAAVTDFAVQVPMTRCPSWRHQLTSANGQPAVAFYLGADASSPHDAWSITVLTLRGDRIAEITSFLGPDHFTPFGLRASLS